MHGARAATLSLDPTMKITVDLHHHDDTLANGRPATLAAMPRAGELLDIFDTRFRVDFIVWSLDAAPVVALQPWGSLCTADEWASKVAADKAGQS